MQKEASSRVMRPTGTPLNMWLALANMFVWPIFWTNSRLEYLLLLSVDKGLDENVVFDREEPTKFIVPTVALPPIQHDKRKFWRSGSAHGKRTLWGSLWALILSNDLFMVVSYDWAVAFRPWPREQQSSLSLLRPFINGGQCWNTFSLTLSNDEEE